MRNGTSFWDALADFDRFNPNKSTYYTDPDTIVGEPSYITQVATFKSRSKERAKTKRITLSSKPTALVA
jgi:hypothetical protein